MKAKTGAILLSILAVIVGFVGGFAYNVFIHNAPKNESYISGDLSIHFMELGNKYCGDSIYIKCGETDILVDAGSRQDSADDIIAYVDQYVEDGKLEYVIATHADQDHIAAFTSTKNRAGIFEYYKVETIIDFPKTNKTTDVYYNYVSCRDNEVKEGAKHYTALQCYNNENGAKRNIKIGNNVEIEILYNYYYNNYTEDENNYSVCFMINQGDNHYLFTGDLEKAGEAELVKFYDDNYGRKPCYCG